MLPYLYAQTVQPLIMSCCSMKMYDYLTAFTEKWLWEEVAVALKLKQSVDV